MKTFTFLNGTEKVPIQARTERQARRAYFNWLVDHGFAPFEATHYAENDQLVS
jgi:hypothetical protein